jgi:hypothetical protein
MAAQKIAQEAGERRRASNGFERLVRVRAEQRANYGRGPSQPVLGAKISQGIDRDETFVREKIKKPIENTRMMSDKVFIAVPCTLAQPLHDDREIDCPAAAPFHQPLKTGKVPR